MSSTDLTHLNACARSGLLGTYSIAVFLAQEPAKPTCFSPVGHLDCRCEICRRPAFLDWKQAVSFSICGTHRVQGLHGLIFGRSYPKSPSATCIRDCAWNSSRMILVSPPSTLATTNGRICQSLIGWLDCQFFGSRLRVIRATELALPSLMTLLRLDRTVECDADLSTAIEKHPPLARQQRRSTLAPTTYNVASWLA